MTTQRDQLARALSDTFGWDVASGPMPWEQMPGDMRLTFQKMADTALALLTPATEEAAAEPPTEPPSGERFVSGDDDGNRLWIYARGNREGAFDALLAARDAARFEAGRAAQRDRVRQAVEALPKSWLSPWTGRSGAATIRPWCPTCQEYQPKVHEHVSPDTTG